VAISPDNHWLVNGSLDSTARLWDLNAKNPAANPMVLRGHEGAVSAVGFSPDNHWLVEVKVSAGKRTTVSTKVTFF
jgi:WD40 repeat protein